MSAIHSNPKPLPAAGGSVPAVLTTSRIHGDGEMAGLIRDRRWGRTPLGPLESWSDTLVASVNILLSARFPMLAFFGPSLIQIYNDAFLPLLAEKHPKALGQPARECWADAWPVVGPQVEAALLQGTPAFHQNVLVPVVRQGQLRDIYWTYNYSPIREPSGKIAGVLVVCHDVTGEMLARRERDTVAEQEKITAALARASSARLDAIYNTSLEYIGLLSTDGIILDCNRASLAFAGNAREDVLGTPFSESPWFQYTPGAPEAIREAVARAAAGEHIRTEIALTRPNSETLTFDFSLSPARDASGNVVFLVPEGHDITHLKRTEAALKDSEKLAAVGRLAASIAHEINNPLESVTNLLYLSQTTQNLDDLHQYLSMAERELRRVSVISTQTLRFYRQTTNPRAVSCRELFDSVLSIHQGRIVNSRIQIEQRLRAQLPIRCFEGEIRQVLMNLIGNAVDAMRATGGRLIIRGREGTHWPTGSKGIFLTVADTGSGIDPANLSRIFEPFFTTKGLAGTGLGLWVSRELARKNGGSIESSSPGLDCGATFILTLPTPPPNPGSLRLLDDSATSSAPSHLIFWAIPAIPVLYTGRVGKHPQEKCR
ncbi:MAG: PAS domain-containing protein, partial [Acidobacteriaceae bacterium]